MDELIEKLRSVKWDMILYGDRAEDDPAAKCVFVDMRPDDFEALLNEAAAKIEALRAEVTEWKRVAAAQAELHGEAEARADKLAEALREVMLWIENWSPPFTEDDEWPDTEAKAQAALHPTAAQENNDA